MATTWYFRNTNAPTGPTATASTDTDSFPTVPADKNTPKDMGATKGSAQTSVAGAYSTSATPKYTMARIFVGPALAAQTLIGGQANYKVGIALTESNAAMNLYHRTFVYVWRSGTGNVKTIIVPTSCATEHGTAEKGCVITATGAAGDFSILANDRIVVEEWFDIRNTKATSYTATLYYDGTTDVVEATATSDAAAFFYCPQTLNEPLLEGSVVESVGLSDVLTKQGIFSRSIAETVPTGDASSRSAQYQRTVPESISSLTDLLSAQLSLVEKVILELLSVADSLTRQGMFARAITEPVAVSDLESCVASYARLIAETVPTIDALTRESVSARIISELTAVQDALSKQATFSRTVIEPVGVSDVETRSANYARVISELVSVADALTSLLSLLQRTVSELIAVADQTVREASFQRIVIETVPTSDLAFRTAQYQRVVQELTALADALSLQLSFSRIIVETVPVIDSLSRIAEYARTVADESLVTDQLTAVFGALERIVTEAIAVADQIIRTAQYDREIQEALATSDTLSALVGALERILQESLSLLDTLTATLNPPEYEVARLRVRIAELEAKLYPIRSQAQWLMRQSEQEKLDQG